MKVEIATTSKEKINGIKNAISRVFKIKESEIEVTFKKVDSKVPEQPFNEETYQGALNRVNTLFEKSDKKADLYISCEAGIESFLGKYFNVQVVCIFDKNTQRYLWGKSAGWQIPSDDIQITRMINLDSYLRGKGITKIEDLLGLNYSRTKAVAQATEVALASAKLF